MESAPPHTPSIVSSRAFWMFFWYSTPQKDRKNKSYFFTAFWRHHRVLTNISLVFPLCPINITNLPLNHHVSRSNPIEITWNHHILIGTIILNHIKSHILWKFQRFSTFFNVSCYSFWPTKGAPGFVGSLWPRTWAEEQATRRASRGGRGSGGKPEELGTTVLPYV